MAVARTVLVAAVLCAAVALSEAGPRVAPEADVAFEYSTTGWRDVGPAHASDSVQVTIALKQRDVDGLRHVLDVVSDPRSAWYGNYLSQDQVTRYTAAPQESIDAVRGFIRQHLKAAGYAERWGERATLAVNRDFLHVRLPVDVANSMFGVRLHRFVPTHRTNDVSFLRADGHYTLPADIAAHVDFVGGLNRLHRPTSNAATPAPATGVTTDSLPAGSSSLVLAAAGGRELTAVVLPRCSDGSVMSSWGSCGQASSIMSVEVVAAPNDASLGPAATATFTSAAAAKVCQACSAYAGQTQYGNLVHRTCTATATKYGLPDASSLVVCAFPLVGVTTTVNATVSVNTTFADGTAATGAGGVFSTFIEPMVTPQFIRDLYLIDVKGNGAGNQSVAEFLGQYYSPSDLAAYLKNYDVSPITDVTVVGPNDAGDAGGEASLDIQVIQGVAAGVPTTFWSTAGLRNNSGPPGPSNQEPFLAWITALMDDPTPPLVHSSSYSDKEAVMPRVFTDRLNVEFMKAGTRGLTLFFATGDDGASGTTCRSGNCSIFNPTFPPSSPYVTSVGGTQMGRPMKSMAPTEVVADSFTGSFITSGGGFSNRYAQPTYQSLAVQGYVAKATMPPASMQYNTSMRAYPDISAISTNFMIFLNSSISPIGGTSASTPTTAAVFSLLNQVRLDAGMPVVGFVNPMLYLLEQAARPYFNDITVGNNKCSAFPTQCADYGFEATPGWDACTGLGSPVFNLLSHAVIPIPGDAVATISTGTVFDVQSAQLLAPRGMWGPCQEAVIEIKGRVNDFLVQSGVVSYKVYELGVNSQIDADSANYFNCTSETCYPSQPVSLWLDDPTSGSSNFTIRTLFRMPLAAVTGEFQLLVSGTDQEKQDDFNVAFTYNFTKLDVPSAGADQGQRCEPFP